MKSENIDWEQLAQKLGTIEGVNEYGSADLARQALVEILGQQAVAHAVDYYVDSRPGCELVRSVLWLLRPLVAMERCDQIFKEHTSIERKRSAVELLRVIGDERTLPLVKKFLNHSDETIQNWGMSLLEKLIQSEKVEYSDVKSLIEMAEAHKNPLIREIAKRLH